MTLALRDQPIIYAVDDEHMKSNLHKPKGFSLLEMLLVMAIMSAILLMVVGYGTQRMEQFKRDKTALQMQQIMNAAMAYYTSQGKWPVAACDAAATGLSVLQGAGYITANMLKSPYATNYQISSQCSTGMLLLGTDALKATNALIIGGSIPGGHVVGTTSVYGQINIPGQNLNNARSVNYAGIYSGGGCVPAPSCPPGMSPSILVSPVSVSGINDAPTGCTGGLNSPAGCSGNVYPISSFTAFARGDATGAPVLAGGSVSAGGGPLDCKVTAAPGAMECNHALNGVGNIPFPTGEPNTTLYWRVCLSVITEKGRVAPGTDNQGRLMGSVLAITRCSPTNESPAGSNINVFSINGSYVP